MGFLIDSMTVSVMTDDSTDRMKVLKSVILNSLRVQPGLIRLLLKSSFCDVDY